MDVKTKEKLFYTAAHNFLIDYRKLRLKMLLPIDVVDSYRSRVMAAFKKIESKLDDINQPAFFKTITQINAIIYNLKTLARNRHFEQLKMTIKEQLSLERIE